MKKIFFLFSMLLLLANAPNALAVANTKDYAHSDKNELKKERVKKLSIKKTSNKKLKLEYTTITWSYYCPGFGEVFWGSTIIYRDMYGSNADYQAAINSFKSDVNTVMDYLDEQCY